MTASPPVSGRRLYSVLLTGSDDTPGTWLTVAADNLVEAMRHARREPWWGDSAPSWAEQARVAAVECLGASWR